MEPTPRPDLEALERRLAVLEAREARRVRRRRAVLLGLVALGVVAAPLALAADGNCPNGLPFCFASDQPARASEVNHNFAQLREWPSRRCRGASASSPASSSIGTAPS